MVGKGVEKIWGKKNVVDRHEAEKTHDPWPDNQTSKNSSFIFLLFKPRTLHKYYYIYKNYILMTQSHNIKITLRRS